MLWGRLLGKVGSDLGVGVFFGVRYSKGGKRTGEHDVMGAGRNRLHALLHNFVIFSRPTFCMLVCYFYVRN